ncbi:phage holin family protein [Actinoplanes friuliensis]|uniref:phage holin family protein n=1 Tax=Actinoplanes friuliensis TaxID=196914 RepID=UPI00059FDB98|nr:phage holin family protein [Actinoplanes friuliensis]
MTDTQPRTVWPAEASTGQLVTQMTEQVSTLVRDELALARTEMVEKGKRAGKGAGLLGGAGVLAMYGVGALLVTVGALLALVWPVWLAALVVTVVVFAVAGVAALIGKKQVQQAVPPAPTAAVDSSKRDVDAVKTAVRDGRHA